jgi:MoaD family protein
MTVTVQYMAQVRQAAGVAAEEVPLEAPCPVQALLARLAERHGEAFRRLVLGPSGQLHPTILVFVGDRQVEDGTHETLRDGDCVTVLSPMAGG